MDKNIYESYVQILNEELLPAMGCTEPISLAYAAALAREILGQIPDRVEISVSGNILKNVKSVIVPNSNGLKGVTAAAAAGIIAGDASKKLQVLSKVSENQKKQIKEYLDTAKFEVSKSNSGCVFDIKVTVFKDKESASVRIEGHHTNVVSVEKNSKPVTYEKSEYVAKKMQDRSVLSVQKIIEFADSVNIADIKEIIERQITCNLAIAEEGLKNDYGAKVGKILLKSFGHSVFNEAKATSAAGSDARMNGCSLPVVIVSGSGNQGITASIPVVIYAKHLGVSHESLLRAVALSDLVTIHLKTGIGRLSAYCGAVSAGAGAGAGICYLYGGKYDSIAHTIVNALAIDSGIICDGAKSSCAAKIATAVESGILGMEMYRNGSQFFGGDGILERGVENTIDNVGILARKGMQGTDEEIINLMIKNLNK